jgi:hypothetical protein
VIAAHWRMRQPMVLTGLAPVTDAPDRDEAVRTVYRLTYDPDRYQTLGFDPAPALPIYEFDGTPKLATWIPQVVRPYQLELEEPDIWFLGGAFTIAMSHPTVDRLEPFLTDAGELIPLTMAGSGEELLALNVLRKPDCLDDEESVIDSLGFSLAFFPSRLPADGLFKVRPGGLAMTETFLAETRDSAASFRPRVTGLGLSGLAFEPIWSSVSGPAIVSFFKFLSES